MNKNLLIAIASAVLLVINVIAMNSGGEASSDLVWFIHVPVGLLVVPAIGIRSALAYRKDLKNT